MSKVPFTAEDLYKIHFVGSPAISHAGDEIVYVDKTIEREEHKKYFSHLWMVKTDGESEPRQMTFGKTKNFMPEWAPDDSKIAFISDRNEDVSQIFILPRDGGEAKQLTDLDRGEIKEFAWAPDGEKIAIVYAKSTAPTDDDGKPEERVVRRITKKWCKIQGKGFIDNEYGQIYIVDTNTGNATQLTDTDYNHGSLSWMPDSDAIVFGANPTESEDFDLNGDRIYIQRLDEETAREIPRQDEGPASLPKVSSDGKTVAYVGHTDPDEAWGAAHQHLWLVPTDGSAPPTNVNPDFGRTIGNNLIHDMGGPPVQAAPIWSSDSQYVYVPVSNEGSIHLYRYSVATGSFEADVLQSGDLTSVTFDDDQNVMACIRANAVKPAEVHIRDLQTDTWSRLTAHNDALLDDREVVKPEEYWVDGPNGKIQSWIMKPVGFEEDKQYPNVMEIHGGPRCMYGDAFFFEFQLLASRGYTVYYCNPSGSQGYSEEFARSITNDWGSKDYVDCMTVAEYFAEFDFIDPKQAGVTGGSYGGYMTNWIIGHTDHFKAAVTQRSVVNLESMAGTSDFGFADKMEFGGYIWENPEGYRRMSPLTYVNKIETPLLIIHGEQDLRCPVEQAEQLFTALKMQNKTVEFLRFPEESHELSRSGRPDRRVVRLEAICDWFDSYVK
ncbi:MAG: S9 family peptidase [Candidatus Marinimicrobia bacterium]|nr:S9 family peptidase [Candidatus Neomarinimicrobiota bacterium]MCF7828827.1 S9 family peptidase [Candidatus Neomarinimicrobiota bacterium]MCF7880744.1 S9 family peptidase [Candidatus Neomarinimicrobiota bacterium]